MWDLTCAQARLGVGRKEGRAFGEVEIIRPVIHLRAVLLRSIHFIRGFIMRKRWDVYLHVLSLS